MEGRELSVANPLKSALASIERVECLVAGMVGRCILGQWFHHERSAGCT